MQNVVRTLLCVVLTVGAAAIRSNAQDHHPINEGAVFVMTNAVDRNEVISFRRAADGSLQHDASVATGGRGTGGVTDPLESQGSLTLSQDHSFLFAVNGVVERLRYFLYEVLISRSSIRYSPAARNRTVAQHGNFV